MKKAIYITVSLAAVALLLTLPACKKTNDYPSHVVTVSYPVVTLNGPSFVTLAPNSTWTDPGASWSDTVTGESGTITFSINTSKDSAYYLVYVATNKNGFSNLYQGSGPPARGVAVTGIGSGIDISGNYIQVGPLGQSAVTLTNVSPGQFFCANIDGFQDPGVIAIKDDQTISIATIEGVSVLYQTYVTSAVVPLVFTPATISYSAPITLNYTETPLNGPNLAVEMVHQRFGH